MSQNIFENLPLGTAGTPGVGVNVSGFGATKTLIMDGPAAMHVDVQFSHDSTDGLDGAWFNIKSLTEKPGKQNFDICCKWLRVSIPSGKAGPSNADVAGTSGGTRLAVVPTIAGQGLGAGVDVSTLGTYNTIAVSGLADGEIVLEASHDDVSYEVCATLKPNSPFCSLEFVAGYVRMNRTSGTGTPTAILCAANDAVTVDNTSTNEVVYRRDGVRQGNVYPTWAGAHARAVFERDRRNGDMQILIDNSDSLHLNGYSEPACEIPAGTYDMDNIYFAGADTRFGGSFGSPGNSPGWLDILDGVVLDDAPGTTGNGPVIITSDGATPGCLNTPGFFLGSPNTALTNTSVSAGAMFKNTFAFQIIVSSVKNMFGGLGRLTGRPNNVAPLIDGNGGFTGILMHNGSVKNNAVTDLVGPQSGQQIFLGFNDLGNGQTPNADEILDFPGLVAGSVIQAFANRYSRSRTSIFGTLPAKFVPAFTMGAHVPLIGVDTASDGGGPAALTLPPASPMNGETIIVKDVGGGAATGGQEITILCGGTDTFEDGSTSYAGLNTAWGSAKFISTGTGKWLRMGTSDI